MSYNGWSNYETWAVKLWMDNEEESYHEFQRIARRAGSVYELANAIESMYEEMMPDLGGTVFGDLLRASLREVDWQEIAAALWEDEREEDEEEEEEGTG